MAKSARKPAPLTIVNRTVRPRASNSAGGTTRNHVSQPLLLVDLSYSFLGNSLLGDSGDLPILLGQPRLLPSAL